MTLLRTEHPTVTETGTLAPRPSLRDTVDQSLAMAWRAAKKMRRNPEQWFDVTIQPLLFTAMFAYIFGGAISGSSSGFARSRRGSAAAYCPTDASRRPSGRSAHASTSSGASASR